MLSLPGGATDLEVRKFLAQSSRWLEDAAKSIATQKAKLSCVPSGPFESFMCFGEPWCSGASAKMLKKRIQQKLLELTKIEVAHHQLIVGAPCGLQTRAARTQWGSLSPSRIIRLNPALAFVPEHVFQYIVAHECAHLIHAHHKKPFWQLVRKLKPDYEIAEAWLKENFGLLAHIQQKWRQWGVGEW